MAGWTTVGNTQELGPGESKAVTVEGKRIALFNVEGTYHAIDDACPHRGGPLSEGEIEGSVVICPWHTARFDVTTGQVLSPPASRGVACYKVAVEGSQIRLELP